MNHEAKATRSAVRDKVLVAIDGATWGYLWCGLGDSLHENLPQEVHMWVDAATDRVVSRELGGEVL